MRQSTEKHATLPRHILTLGRPVCALTPKCCMISREAANTKYNVFGLTRPGIEPTTTRTRGEHANHYTFEAVYWTPLLLSLWNDICKSVTISVLKKFLSFSIQKKIKICSNTFISNKALYVLQRIKKNDANVVTMHVSHNKWQKYSSKIIL